MISLTIGALAVIALAIAVVLYTNIEPHNFD